MALQNYSIQTMKTFFTEKYYIPNYQREYSWEEDEISDFLSDIEETKAHKESIHFFGQIVVHNDEKENRKYIIDGQQRSISAIIFLRVLQSMYSDLYFATKYKPAEKKEVIISDLIGEYTDEEKNLHLTLGEADNDYFISKVILVEQPSLEKAKKKSNERIRKAYKKIFDYVKEKYDSETDAGDKMACLNDYLAAFTDRFKVMYMEATKLEEAFVIFETLNARGKDLETADLLKNYIFSKASDISEAQKLWKSMLSKLDTIDPTNYIRHYWNASHDFTREKALYRIIVQNIKKPKDAGELLKDLEEYAQCYHDMALPDTGSAFSDKKLVASLKNLKVLKAKTFYPVLLAMKQAKKPFSDEDIRKVAETIEKYVFRNFTICGKVANTGEKFLAEIAVRIFDDLKTVDLICNEITKGICQDNEFELAFENWNSSNRDTVRYILQRIEKKIAPTEELSIDHDDVHIEHIMPVNNTKWKVDEEVHTDYLWRLGNLTLLSGTINESISNDVFAIKVSQYVDSKIELNKYLCQDETGEARVEWKIPEDTEKRQKRLTAYAMEIWQK